MSPTCYKEGEHAFRVCIVGAGFSGAILAKQLERAGLNIEVMLFEKVRRRGTPYWNLRVFATDQGVVLVFVFKEFQRPVQ